MKQTKIDSVTKVAKPKKIKAPNIKKIVVGAKKNSNVIDDVAAITVLYTPIELFLMEKYPDVHRDTLQQAVKQYPNASASLKEQCLIQGVTVEDIFSAIESFNNRDTDVSSTIDVTPEMPQVRYDFPEHFESDSSQSESKLANEKRFAKIALCIGIGLLVLMILNKK